MILDELKNAKQYAGIHAGVDKALEAMKQYTADNYPLGKVEIDGDNVFLLLNSYETRTKEEAKAEAHRKYIDVMYMVEGAETIYVKSVDRLKNITTEYTPEMEALLAECDHVVVASPVYFGTLPGQMLNLMSRLQPWHAATYFIKKPLQLRPKKVGVILTGGGKNNLDMAHHHLRAMCRMLNADWEGAALVTSANTDTVPAWEDAQALEGVREMARRRSQA